jgi:hypothetical protein
MTPVTRDTDGLCTVRNHEREFRPAALLCAAARSVDTSELCQDAVGIAVDGRGRVIIDDEGPRNAW